MKYYNMLIAYCYKQLFLCILSIFSISGLAYAEVPIATDNRIKTYIYNENEVYSVLVH